MFDWREIAVRAGVTAGEAAAAVLLAGNLFEWDASKVQTAVAAGLAAGLSVLWNAGRTWADRRRNPPGGPGIPFP